VLPAPDDTLLGAIAAAQALTRGFGLRGINGIDFIARNGTAVVIEVNPRWTAAVELVERSLGLSLFAAHAAAVEGSLPQLPRSGEGVFGKAVVFAPSDCVVPVTDSWLADTTLADVPSSGTAMPRGAPICTVFASAASGGCCYDALRARADAIVRECLT
jgi:predicted ATP-grasp superfamily ATP-dependent carboligase